MNAVKVFENDNYRFSVFQDDIATNPRENCEHTGTMVCMHRDYCFGDKQLRASDYESWDDVKKSILHENTNAVILPLRIYDHSGVTMSTTNSYPYNDQWDSSMVGFIYTTKERMKKLWGDQLPRTWRKKAVEVLVSEVKEYDNYLTGNIYGFTLEKKINHKACEHCGAAAYTEYIEEDSCWEIFGDWETSGLLDNMPEELKVLNKKAS